MTDTPTLIKHAIITGAAQRLGREMALHLARNGWDITVHYHTSAKPAEDVCQQIQAHGVKAHAVQANLSAPKDTSAFIDTAVSNLGEAGVLINNASTFEPDAITDFGPNDWDKHMQPNFQAPITLAKAFAQHLPPTSHGLIINMTDQRVWRTNPNYFTYTLSKCALWAATPVMAQALAPRVRVNAIGPGPVLRNERMSQEDFVAQGQKVPLGRNADVADILSALDFFIHAPSVTGQMLAIDSGQHLAWKTPDVVDVNE